MGVLGFAFDGAVFLAVEADLGRAVVLALVLGLDVAGFALAEEDLDAEVFGWDEADFDREDFN